MGALASLAGTGVLFDRLPPGSGLRVEASLAIYGAALFLAYLASALFHGAPAGRAKRLFQTIDHCTIYLLIAGSYTPFAAISLWRSDGPAILALVWSLAALGIFARLAVFGRLHWSAAVHYLAMGWLCVFWLPSLHAALGAGLWYLLAGGVAYTLGFGFFGLTRVPFANLVWHLFVIAGSAIQFAAVLLYAVPAAA